MKKALSFIALAVAFTTFSAFTFFNSGGHEYVGSKSCKGCHGKKTGNQYKHWTKTAHANAFKTLKTPEADKIAKEKGFKTKAAETDNCLSCHVTGMLEKGAKFGKKFKKEEGVGCEACHGAGKDYKSKHKKDIKKGIAAGMLLPKVDDGSAEKQCVTCHNEKSPTYKKFDFKTKWAEVAHPKPKK